MSAHVWSTRADVLKDLKAVTGGGGSPGVTILDGFVVVGERPPPTPRESISEEEIQCHFGVSGSTGDSVTAPDLNGISHMLQLVREVDDDDNEPKTIFRNTLTDEISISKLNPNVTEFVPSGCKQSKPQTKHRTPEKPNVKHLNKNRNNQLHNKTNNENAILNKNAAGDTKQVEDKEITDTPARVLNGSKNNTSINGLAENKSEIVNSLSNSTNTLSKATVSSSDLGLDKKLDVSKMKNQEIEEMKKQVRSKIIDSSQGDSMQHKKQKNVAIATLLRLCTASPVPNPPVENAVKLITPDFFEISPATAKVDVKKESPVKEVTELTKDELEKTPATSKTATSNPEVNYVDPFIEESITKVNNWFDNAGTSSPKPKQLPVLPTAAPASIQFKETVSFKKKNTSNLTVNSPKSETSSEKKKQCASFVPSEYANNLLKKYEQNAKSKVGPKEDWRVTLERQLQEKDEAYRKKMLEQKNTTSASSGSAD